MIKLLITYECGACNAKNEFEPDDECLAFDVSGGRSNSNYVYDNCSACGVKNSIKIYAPNRAKAEVEV